VPCPPRSSRTPGLVVPSGLSLLGFFAGRTLCASSRPAVACRLALKPPSPALWCEPARSAERAARGGRHRQSRLLGGGHPPSVPPAPPFSSPLYSAEGAERAARGGRHRQSRLLGGGHPPSVPPAPPFSSPLYSAFPSRRLCGARRQLPPPKAPKIYARHRSYHRLFMA
jgi:hypothetical protein